jgi:DNA-binding winged helix-turn-helix (wHTH) protein
VVLLGENVGHRLLPGNGRRLPCVSPDSPRARGILPAMPARVRLARFGPFEADLRTAELRRSGKPIGLQELPFRILAALLERPGELVTREELRAVAWPDDVFVDFEHGLNKAVNKIRRALGDRQDEPRYVATLPGRGYRFIAAVELAEAVEAPRSARGSCRILWDSRTIALSEGAHLIGRDPEATVWVDSSTVSRRHALIVVSPGAATLEDLGSKNGTFLCGHRIASPTPLADGDELAVGSARMTFHSSVAASTKTGTGSR